MPQLPTIILLIAFSIAPGFAALPEPTKSDVSYSPDHKRNVLDFWAAKPGAQTPAPVIVWFHGGGFRQGDKTQIRKRGSSMFEAYLDAGYAIVSCNYPFLDKDTDYEKIVRQCARAVRFTRSQASTWKIDPDRLIAGGPSAGALISECLAYHNELDKGLPKDDPTAKFSSRPQVVLSHLQPIGTKDFALDHMEAGEAPIFIYSNARKTDRIHDPKQAIKLRDRAQQLGIPVIAISSGRNDIPKAPTGTDWLKMQLKFCKEHLEAAKKAKSAPSQIPANKL